MKHLLSASLCLNVFLLLLAVWRRDAIRDALMTREVRMTGLESVKRPGPGSASLPTAGGGATQWNSVESKDLSRLIANLRAAGCPEQTVADLVTMRVCRAYRARVLELLSGDDTQVPYWKFRSSRAERDRQARIQDLGDQLKGDLESLLGLEAGTLRGRLMGWPEAMWGDGLHLPLEKTAQLREVAQRYRHLAQQDDAERGETPWGYRDPEAVSRELERHRQQQEEIRTLLTPEEYDQYQLRQSPAARYVLQHVPDAKSEAEYQRMVRVAEELGMGLPPDPAGGSGAGWSEDTGLAKVEAEREAAFRERLKEELGEDLIAEREKQEAEERARQNEKQEFQEMTELAQSVGATAKEAEAFFARLKEMRPELEKRFEAEEKGAVTPEEKEAFKAMVQAELERIATEAMGQEKARALVRKAIERESQ